MGRRIRSIKPEIVEDEKTANLGHLEWRLFVSLWVIADDYGNLRGDAQYVRGSVLWAARHANDDVAGALEALASAGLIEFYRVRGQLYIHIPGWKKHQKVDKPGKPQMPGPEDTEAQGVRAVNSNSRESREISRESRESLATDRDQDQRSGGEASRGSPEEISPTTQPPEDLHRRSAIAPPPAKSADADQISARRKLTDWGLDELNRIRARVAAKFGWDDVRPIHPMDVCVRDLRERLSEAGPAGEEQLKHVLRIAELDAIAKQTVEYLGGGIFRDTSWSKKLGMREADALRAIGKVQSEPARAMRVKRRDDDDMPPLGPEGKSP